MTSKFLLALLPLLLMVAFMGLTAAPIIAQDQVVSADFDADGNYDSVTFSNLRKTYTTSGAYRDGTHTGWTWEEGTGYDIIVFDAAAGKVWKFNGLDNHLNTAGTIEQWTGTGWQGVGNWQIP